MHQVIVNFEQKSIQQDSEQIVDQNPNEESLVKNLDQATTDEEQTDNPCADSNMPKINYKIRYRLPGEDWVVTVVIGRGGKVTGKNKHYFNICNIDNGEELGIHLDKTEFQVLKESVSGQGLNEQSYGESNDNVEVVQAVFIPTEHHSDPDVLETKQKELENWTNSGVYNELDDQGQRTISTKWVVSERELSDGLKCVKARLVLRGFQEDEKGPVDSPTVSKSSMRISLLHVQTTIGSVKQWISSCIPSRQGN